MRKRLSMLFLMLILVFVMGMTVSAATVQMNKTSATIQTGETLKLSVLVNGAEKAADAWGSSEKSVATVSSSGVVTGLSAGSTVITAMVDGSTVECIVSVVKRSTNTTTRYNVLVIDTSNSVKGTPLKRVKMAAKRFCSAVLKTSGDNYVAVVTFSGKAKVACGFTNNLSTLNTCINNAKVSKNTNMNQAFETADRLLASVPNGSKTMKNVILCSDGLPQTGSKSASGRYNSDDHKTYKYANAVYKTDVELKNKGYFIYALGFFHNSTGKSLAFGKQLMKDLASKDKYYVVTDVKDIDDVFDDIADKITKTTISQTSLTLYVGETYQLTAYVNGAASSAKWKSSKKGVASVNSNGLVTAKKKGKTTVTATVNGKSVKCKVTVKKKKEVVQPTIKLNKTSVNLYVGQKETLKATVTGKSSKVKWTTSDKKIATVNSKGVVKGVNEGKVVITATANGVSATCTVNVLIKHPMYSQYFMMEPQKSRYGSQIVDEYGVRLEVNEDAVIEKCAVYVYKSGSTCKRTLACTGTNIKYAYYVPYLAYKGEVIYDGMKVSNINTYSLQQDSTGVWSRNRSFGLINANLEDANGNELAVKSTGVAERNTKVFYDLNEMKAWLRE